MAAFFDRLERRLESLTRPLSTLGVLGMLVAAGATVVDVLFRSVVNSGVVALNEITSMAFAIAIAACIPAGVAVSPTCSVVRQGAASPVRRWSRRTSTGSPWSSRWSS